MARSPFYRLILISALIISACSAPVHELKYTGSIVPEEHRWLAGKRIFIDPGHGGLGKNDKFRTAKNGLTEEEVNLRVSLILQDMLKHSGANVLMSRDEDRDISLDKRVAEIKGFKPDLLVSIHHNGSPRREDKVNYPAVFIWGSRHVNPAGYDFAGLLLDEFHNVMDEKGLVVSDFSVFSETGTKVLRETIDTCPGVIGEMGFFSDEKHSYNLKDIHYNEKEAEAYFSAISKYMKFGRPSADMLFSCAVEEAGKSPIIKESAPLIALRFTSGNELPSIDIRSLVVTLDNIRIWPKKISETIYLLNYGKRLYPGGHRIRASVKNQRGMSSMIMSAGFVLDIKKGDYDLLVAQGRRLIKQDCNQREGLKMLLSAYYMSPAGPESDKLCRDIAYGFRLIGDYAAAEYFDRRLAHFYPNSVYNAKTKTDSMIVNGYRFPVDFYGQKIPISGNAAIYDCAKDGR